MDAHGFINRRLFIPLFDRMDKRKRLSLLPAIRNFNSLDHSSISRTQWQAMERMLRHAYRNIPFYRESFDEAGVSPEDIRAPEDLTRLPVLRREDIRRNGDRLLAPGADKAELVKTATGGTISSPIDLYLDKECFDQRLAATIVFNEWFDYHLGDKSVLLWGAAQDFPKLSGLDAFKAKTKNLLTGRIMWLPTSFLNDRIFAEYYERLRAYEPAVIQAYPTPLYLLAQYMAKHGLTYKPKTITVAAETLYDFQRELIEAQFGCKIFNWYGSRELGHMASECRMHAGLHINAYHLYIEAVCEGRQVFEKEASLVVTDLRNHTMPLIRYEIGDVGVLTKRECPCGCKLPLLERVSGRLVDTFVTRTGAMVPGVALTNRVIKDCAGIEQMQIVQEDFDRFLIRIIKGRAFSENILKSLERLLEDYLQSELDVRYEFVDRIPLEKSGKSRFCICKMPADRAARVIESECS